MFQQSRWVRPRWYEVHGVHGVRLIKVFIMDVLYLLIPISVLLVFAVMGVFWWALQAGQFDNIEREGERILRGD